MGKQSHPNHHSKQTSGSGSTAGLIEDIGTSTKTTPTTRITFSDLEIIAIEDALAYYATCEYGGRVPDDDDYNEIRNAVDKAAKKIDRANERLGL